MQVTMSNWEAKEGLTHVQVTYGALDVLVRLALSERLTDYAPQQLRLCACTCMIMRRQVRDTVRVFALKASLLCSVVSPGS